jgi:hypothetical protein
MTNLCVFDAYGKIRSDLESEAATIEALPDEARAKLFACITAVKASEAGQDRVSAARKDVREKDAVWNAALLAYEQTQVPQSAENALRAVIAAQRPGYKPTSPDDERKAMAKAFAKDVAKLEASHAKLRKDENSPDAAIKKVDDELARARALLANTQLPEQTRAAMDAANVSLAEARSELTRATTDQRALEATAGKAINAWRLCGTTPSRDENIRNYVNASTDERARRVAAGLSAETPKIQPHASQSELDKVFAARGKVQNRLPQFLGKR